MSALGSSPASSASSPVSTGPVALALAPASSSTKLERVLLATLKRNIERPHIDFSIFDASRIPSEQRAALAFLIRQIEYIESVSPKNLANLAGCVPRELPTVRACFAAQIHDEIAHGAMLDRWLGLHAGGAEERPHPAAVFGATAAALTQRDPWLGTKNAALLIEYYASALIDELAPKIEEPCLRAVLDHIQKDEHRHKVIASESVRALKDAGSDRRIVARMLAPVVDKGTLLYFRHVFGWFLDEKCASLELPHAQILERALDEAHASLT